MPTYLPPQGIEELVALLAAHLRREHPGVEPEEMLVYCRGRKRPICLYVKGPVEPPLVATSAPQMTPPAFVQTAYQDAIMDALDGVALRTDPLGAAVGDRSRLFKPGGLSELRKAGRVAHHPRLGFYRPDRLPPELELEGENGEI